MLVWNDSTGTTTSASLSVVWFPSRPACRVCGMPHEHVGWRWVRACDRARALGLGDQETARKLFPWSLDLERAEPPLHVDECPRVHLRTVWEARPLERRRPRMSLRPVRARLRRERRPRKRRGIA